MAITITTSAGFEHDIYDKSCVGHLVELQYDVNFGAVVTNELINVNIWPWNSQLEIQNNIPPFFNINDDPKIGYNIVCAGAGSFIEMVPASFQPTRKSSKNVEMWIRFVTTSTAIIRVRFMHTTQAAWWMRQNFETFPNFKRMFHSEVNETNEYDIRPNSMYDRSYGQSYFGLTVQRYTPAVSPLFVWERVEQRTYAEYRDFAWWWNQLNTDPTDVTDTPVLTYQWEFSRNSIPVGTLSLTEDTDVLFRVTVVPDMVFLDEYFVALIKIDPIADNIDEFWKELPMAEGEVTAVNTFGAAETWFPHELNGVEIVGDCAMFAETAPGSDIWECDFTIPKEVVDIGCTYRLGIILKHEFTGPPL